MDGFSRSHPRSHERPLHPVRIFRFDSGILGVDHTSFLRHADRETQQIQPQRASFIGAQV